MEFLPFPCCLQLPRIVPHCTSIKQWGTFNFNQTIWVDYNSSWSKTINFPISFNHVLWVYPSSPPKSFLEQAYYTNSGLYLFHSPCGQNMNISINFKYLAIGY